MFLHGEPRTLPRLSGWQHMNEGSRDVEAGGPRGLDDIYIPTKSIRAFVQCCFSGDKNRGIFYRAELSIVMLRDLCNIQRTFSLLEFF